MFTSSRCNSRWWRKHAAISFQSLLHERESWLFFFPFFCFLTHSNALDCYMTANGGDSKRASSARSDLLLCNRTLWHSRAKTIKSEICLPSGEEGKSWVIAGGSLCKLCTVKLWGHCGSYCQHLLGVHGIFVRGMIKFPIFLNLLIIFNTHYPQLTWVCIIVVQSQLSYPHLTLLLRWYKLRTLFVILHQTAGGPSVLRVWILVRPTHSVTSNWKKWKEVW